MSVDSSKTQENQLKSRSHRRLVGVVALVLALVILLPIFLKDRSTNSATPEVSITLPNEVSATKPANTSVSPNAIENTKLSETAAGSNVEASAPVKIPQPVVTEEVVPQPENVAIIETDKTSVSTAAGDQPKPLAGHVNQNHSQVKIAPITPTVTATATIPSLVNQSTPDVKPAENKALTTSKEPVKKKTEAQKDEVQKIKANLVSDKAEDLKKEDVKKINNKKLEAKLQALTASNANINSAKNEDIPIKAEGDKKFVSSGTYYVQIGVFSDPENVKKLQSKLTELGYSTRAEKLATPNGDKIRLRTVAFSDRNEASIALENIKSSDMTGMVVSGK